jgi:Domain of unknown function (DUF4386)
MNSKTLLPQFPLLASPRRKARVAGGFYLVIIVLAMFAEVFVRGSLVVSGDFAATAANILAHEALFRAGFAADLIVAACDVAVAILFYEIFRPVNRGLALAALLFRLAHAAIMAGILLFHFAPLILLSGGHYLGAFQVDQLQALSLASLRLHAVGYNVCLVFFGIHCVLIGYLIAISTFLPRVLGVLMALAGLCYLTHSFTVFLAPALANHLFPYILLPGALAEYSLTGWLIFVGLNASKWNGLANTRA